MSVANNIKSTITILKAKDFIKFMESMKRKHIVDPFTKFLENHGICAQLIYNTMNTTIKWCCRKT